MKTKIIIFVMALMMVFSFGEKAYSQEDMDSSKMKVIVGRVIDVSCYITGDNEQMADKECVVNYLKVGQPAGILEEGTDNLYIVAKTQGEMTNLAAQLIPYAGDKVRVKGIVNSRAGVTTIDVEEIENIE